MEGERATVTPGHSGFPTDDDEALRSAAWTVFQDFTVEHDSFFLPGATNRLEARILNTGGPTGVQAQFQGTCTPPVPGPAPLLGVAASLGSSRRWRGRQRLRRVAR